MNINPDKVLQLLSQVIGDPLHQEHSVWVRDNGKGCRNIVPISSQVKGVSCLQAIQDLPSNYLTKQKLALGGKLFLCSECRRQGWMRVSVYKGPGLTYLTRTEGLKPVLIRRSGVVLVE
jgi:hypothetical protein